MLRLVMIALLVAACGGQAGGGTAGGGTAGGGSTYPVSLKTDGECDVETLADRVDPFSEVPYTMELPAAWLALPPTCVTPLSDYRVTPVPGQKTARLVVGPPVDTENLREQEYAEREAIAGQPLPSGLKPWAVPPAFRRVDLPVGPALEITYTTPAAEGYRSGQHLLYYIWVDGQVVTFDFNAEPVEFAGLEAQFRAIAETMRVKATTDP